MGLQSDLSTLGDGPTPGTPVAAYWTSDRVRALISLVRGLSRGDNIKGGFGMLRQSVADGVILSTRPTRSSSAATTSNAFDVEVTPSGEGYRLSVLPGLINGILPSNYDITHTTSNAAQCVFLLLTGTVANGGIVSATLSFGSTVAPQVTPNEGMPPSDFSWTLGMLVAGKWYKLVAGSLTVTPKEVFRTAKTQYLPGELPYEPWYTWDVSFA
jgi:hypothetical protein